MSLGNRSPSKRLQVIIWTNDYLVRRPIDMRRMAICWWPMYKLTDIWFGNRLPNNISHLIYNPQNQLVFHYVDHKEHSSRWRRIDAKQKSGEPNLTEGKIFLVESFFSRLSATKPINIYFNTRDYGRVLDFHLSKVIYKHCPIHSLQWCHNERDGFSDHRRLYCLLNCLFRRGSKKASKLRVTGLCEGNPSVTGGFSHKGSVTRKMFPFDSVIISYSTVPTPAPLL